MKKRNLLEFIAREVAAGIGGMVEQRLYNGETAFVVEMLISDVANPPPLLESFGERIDVFKIDSRSTNWDKAVYGKREYEVSREYDICNPDFDPMKIVDEAVKDLNNLHKPKPKRIANG